MRCAMVGSVRSAKANNFCLKRLKVHQISDEGKFTSKFLTLINKLYIFVDLYIFTFDIFYVYEPIHLYKPENTIKGN